MKTTICLNAECGSAIKESFNFCPYCGTRLKETQHHREDMGDYPDGFCFELEPSLH